MVLGESRARGGMRKFMRTRSRELGAPSPEPPPQPPPPQPANGHARKNNPHANGSAGVTASRREDHSTLSVSSRHWSESEWSGAAREGPGDGELEGAPAWEDPDFPASWRSIGDRRAAAGLVWMRPHELCARPTFLSATPEDPDSELFATRWRVELGPLGDPHVCCAAAALALTPRLLARVAPHQRPHPARRYKFRFWVWGVWREVCVDDRLPSRAGRPLGARGGVPGDVALPLLEKAYAKLHGSYRALRAGSAARALQDLSGGAVQALPLGCTPRALLARVLHSAMPRSTLVVGVCAARRAHAVSGLARVRTRDEPLVRLRALSAAPPPLAARAAAAALPPADRDLLAARAPAPNDYWMSLSEMYAALKCVHLVHVGPDDWMAEPALQARRPWRAVVARRRWRAGYNAGGPPGARRAHANPHFHVSVPRDEAQPARRTLCVVSLTQRYSPGAGGGEAALLGVGFGVYALGAEGAEGARRTLDAQRAVAAREVVTFLALPAGRYLVVPHTQRAHTDHAFLLRILTDERTDVWEVNEDNAVVRGIADEFEETQRALPEAARAAALRLLDTRDPDAEVDARRLGAALARHAGGAGGAGGSAALCRALVALRDSALQGCMRAADLPPLLALLAYWRHAYGTLAHAGAGRCGRARPVSSYSARALLAAGGVRASNKVVECVVSRWARNRRLHLDEYLLALATLHLAHERYRCLDAKLKSNPLSLEEMILMTIYS